MHATLSNAVDQYVATAIVHAECTESGDYKRGNRAIAEQMKALERLRAAGEQGTEALLNLLEHESRSVRLSAAADLVRAGLEQKRATKTLREIAQSGGHQGFDAKNILSEFQKGRLTDPLEDLARAEEEAARRRHAFATHTVKREHPLVDDILQFAATLPMRVPSSQISELDTLDSLEERIALVKPVVGDFFGFGSEFAELCPDPGEEPSMAVRLAWAWVVRPDLDKQIAPHVDASLRDVMAYYRSG